MSEPVNQDFTACPHWGQGGRYVVDPATGQRVPAPAEPAATDSQPLLPPEKSTKKGR
jgi:hypothetical protein